MKLVIDIPKTVYKACKEKMDNGKGGLWLEAVIAKGTQYEERPKGEWLHENDDRFDWYVCSHCGYGDEGEVTDNLSAYCPCCGADMRGESDAID